MLIHITLPKLLLRGLAVTFFSFCVNALAQVSNVEGIKPLEGVTIPKGQSPKYAENTAAAAKFSWPSEGKIISTFDPNRKGIDIAGQLGQPILAAGDGTVLYAKYMRGYGNLVIIDHNDGLVTASAHNNNIFVKEGQTVARGQKIADMGNSDTDTVKLHFEVRHLGKPVDPLGMLPLKVDKNSIKSEQQKNIENNSYARKVAGIIKSHTILPQNDIEGNPAVEFLIELQSDGGLRSELKMTKSSGIAAFDQAVKRAIEKSIPFPPDPSTGKVPGRITLTHRLKDSDTR
jgi:TonB family protein